MRATAARTRASSGRKVSGLDAQPARSSQCSRQRTTSSEAARAGPRAAEGARKRSVRGDALLLEQLPRAAQRCRGELCGSVSSCGRVEAGRRRRRRRREEEEVGAEQRRGGGAVGCESTGGAACAACPRRWPSWWKRERASPASSRRRRRRSRPRPHLAPRPRYKDGRWTVSRTQSTTAPSQKLTRRPPPRSIFLILLVAIGAAAGGWFATPKGDNQVCVPFLCCTVTTRPRTPRAALRRRARPEPPADTASSSRQHDPDVAPPRHQLLLAYVRPPLLRSIGRARAVGADLAIPFARRWAIAYLAQLHPLISAFPPRPLVRHESLQL